jgi:hypothetical protein
MDSAHREYLEQRYAAKEWYGRGAAGRRRMIEDFAFEGSELRGWTLLRVPREEGTAPPVIRAFWHRGDPMLELLSIDVWVCGSARAAHDQLLEALGNIQSDAVERRDGFGDVAFALDDMMALFARANVVVLIRNAGPKAVQVGPVARAIDELLVRRSGGGEGRRRR